MILHCGHAYDADALAMTQLGACSFSAAFRNGYKFTGKERDSESGLDYFGARHYASSLGRWVSPDKPFADQHAANPQSWNLYSYTRNNPVAFVDPNGRAVEAMTALALQRIQSTLPKDVRSQVTADKSGLLNRKTIDAIKSNDSNVSLLKRAVDATKTIEVTTAPALQGGQPKELVDQPFSYQSVADQQAIVKAAGGDPSGITIPSLYLGVTQLADQSGSGNVRVTLSDGTGAAASAPESEQAVTAAHELYGHALPNVNGQPSEHDNGGPVDKNIKKIEDHTKELN